MANKARVLVIKDSDSVTDKEITKDLLIELLRYAGVLTLRGIGGNEIVVYAPKHAGDNDQWARMNVQRIASFGVEAYVEQG